MKDLSCWQVLFSKKKPIVLIYSSIQIRSDLFQKHFLLPNVGKYLLRAAVEQPMAARKSLPQKTNGAKNRGDVKVDTAGVMTTRHLSFSRSFLPPCHSSSRCTDPRHWDCCRAIYHGHRNRCESIFLLSKMASALPPAANNWEQLFLWIWLPWEHWRHTFIASLKQIGGR